MYRVMNSSGGIRVGSAESCSLLDYSHVSSVIFYTSKLNKNYGTK